MIDKELIENWRNMVKPSISSLLFKTNYEGMGEQDKEEFERDFDEILDLALIGLKHKAQLSQEGTTKDATSDTISRKGIFIPDITVEMFRNASLESIEDLMASGEMEDILLPSAQPERTCVNCVREFETRWKAWCDEREKEEK